MDNKKRAGANIAFWLAAGALIVYGASRSLHFINSTMAGDQAAAGWLALAASTFGALSWLAVLLHAAQGVAQVTIAQVMIAVDVLAEIVLLSADTLTGAQANGLIIGLTPGDLQFIVYALSALIGLNIAASFLYKILDPGTQAALEIYQAEAEIGRAIREAKVAKARELSAGIAQRAAEQYALELTPDAPVPVLSSLFGTAPKEKGGIK